MLLSHLKYINFLHYTKKLKYTHLLITP